MWAPSTGPGPGVPDSPEADPPCAGRRAGAGSNRCARVSLRPRETPGVRVAGAAGGCSPWWTEPGAGRTAPTPRGLDPRTVAACFPRTGGESARRRGGGARKEGAPPLVCRTPTLLLGTGVGRPARRLGRGRGAQTKGACAFKAGSRGAGGEGTSGSGVEGGCAGQQGGGAGRADGGRPEGRPGRADTEQGRGTAGPPAGARGGGGAGARARRRPGPAGETRPGVGGAGARGGRGTPAQLPEFLGGRGSGWPSPERVRGEPEAAGAAGGSGGGGGGSGFAAPTPCRTRPGARSRPGKGVLGGGGRPEGCCRGRASKFGFECDCVSGKERQPGRREGCLCP